MQKECIFTGGSTSLPYLIHVPDRYVLEGPCQYPLLLFLHGAGERGNDLALLKNHGLPKLLEQKEYHDFPFVTVSPQCPEDSYWTEHLTDLKLFLDYLIDEYEIDVNSICLTGMSMGGIGAWNLALQYPDFFHALAPVCGSITLPTHRKKAFHELYTKQQVLEAITRIKHLPIWAFHGALDEVVPIDETKQIVAHLQELGAHVQLTVYPDIGHDSWVPAYETEELYWWLYNA
ncbi:prolyl oligopeptidase family serine peptidase [Gracilibacillus salinarum]|uniref:Prolyl oligopeptidase family serine peptidase n=1 Tax=Gracilibacillus salinarum TaxID=2932255 RepID=A0ABY4GPN3_9BACI|nr:prolyl oligopeptidase family serine peptidase [Gracilibacillus salinarum]UOQ86307.1 prolyl oligopeptidase family serine peptidase [Gracilibacillus salinarum]